MNDIIFNEELKELSDHVYKRNINSPTNGWKILKVQDSTSGFRGLAYQKGNNIVISFAGTNPSSWQDWESNVHMGAAFKPPQLNDAQKFYNSIKGTYQTQNITFTGHSLGGSLAQLMSAETGKPAVTFGAYGTGDILFYNYGITDISGLNITNYGNLNDIVFADKLLRQPGRTFVVNASRYGKFSQDRIYGIYREFKLKGDYDKPLNFLDPEHPHYTDNMGDLNDSIEVKPSAKPETQVLKGRISQDEFRGGIQKEGGGSNPNGETPSMTEDQYAEYLRNDPNVNKIDYDPSQMTESQYEESLKQQFDDPSMTEDQYFEKLKNRFSGEDFYHPTTKQVNYDPTQRVYGRNGRLLEGRVSTNQQPPVASRPFNRKPPYRTPNAEAIHQTLYRKSAVEDWIKERAREEIKGYARDKTVEYGKKVLKGKVEKNEALYKLGAKAKTYASNAWRATSNAAKATWKAGSTAVKATAKAAYGAVKFVAIKAALLVKTAVVLAAKAVLAAASWLIGLAFLPW